MMEVLSRVRGLVVGYCLGDALARSPEPWTGTLIAGTPSLMFLTGVEGVIRGLVRADVTGRDGGLAETCWHATARWAARTRMGSLPQVQRWADAASPQPWPDGWLSDLSLLSLGRGSAPAVEAALECADLDPRPGMSGADSAGDLVLSRTLPVALLAVADRDGELGHAPLDEAAAGRLLAQARDVAGYTHGLPAQVIAVALARTLAEDLVTGSVHPLTGLADLSAAYEGVAGGDEVIEARVALRALADKHPPYPPLTELATRGVPSGPRTALRAVAEGLRCALTHPGREDVDKAVQEATRTGQPAAAAVALAMVGAAHGLTALPVDAVARLDVGHVADQLASDVVQQARNHPVLGDPGAASTWLHRYPAW
jgi:hypothetical protein